MKSLLAVPPIWAGCEEAVAFACSTAQRLAAALDVVFLDDRGDYPVLASVGEAMYGMSHEVREEEERRELVEDARQLHASMVSSGSLAGRFVEEPQTADRVMTSLARLQDAILLARPTEQVGKTYQEAARIAIFESNRPVLVAPSSLKDLRLGHAFVVWSESAQAAGAVQAFAQLAGRFERVTLAGFGAPEFGPVESFLSRHGATMAVRSLAGDGLSARQRGRAVIAEACGAGADMLVMGAFGDGRLDRLLGLGGSTEKVVTSCPMALLLAH
jgi:nucleotide-binding universal stress UspA family protein